MNIKKLLKILGFIIVPILPMAIAIYFLFPYINKDQYATVIEKKENYGLSLDSVATKGTIEIATDFETLKEQVEAFQKRNATLSLLVDSLRTVNDSLKNELAVKVEELEQVQAADGPAQTQKVALSETQQQENEETFKENVKSLLSLDDENLAPILNQMSDEQLVRLYRSGSSIQRKKLLRTLESKRAAKLMSEIL